MEGHHEHHFETTCTPAIAMAELTVPSDLQPQTKSDDPLLVVFADPFDAEK